MKMNKVQNEAGTAQAVLVEATRAYKTAQKAYAVAQRNLNQAEEAYNTAKATFNKVVLAVTESTKVAP